MRLLYFATLDFNVDAGLAGTLPNIIRRKKMKTIGKVSEVTKQIQPGTVTDGGITPLDKRGF